MKTAAHWSLLLLSGVTSVMGLGGLLPPCAGACLGSVALETGCLDLERICPEDELQDLTECILLNCDAQSYAPVVKQITDDCSDFTGTSMLENPKGDPRDHPGIRSLLQMNINLGTDPGQRGLSSDTVVAGAGRKTTADPGASQLSPLIEMNINLNSGRQRHDMSASNKVHPARFSGKRSSNSNNEKVIGGKASDSGNTEHPVTDGSTPIGMPTEPLLPDGYSNPALDVANDESGGTDEGRKLFEGHGPPYPPFKPTSTGITTSLSSVVTTTTATLIVTSPVSSSSQNYTEQVSSRYTPLAAATSSSLTHVSTSDQSELSQLSQAATSSQHIGDLHVAAQTSASHSVEHAGFIGGPAVTSFRTATAPVEQDYQTSQDVTSYYGGPVATAPVSVISPPPPPAPAQITSSFAERRHPSILCISFIAAALVLV